MADKIIKVKIDVSKILKDWLFKGEKGNYLNCTILYNENKDTYENNGMVIQDVPKAIYEKDKTIKGPILGNVSEFTKKDSAAESKPGTETGEIGQVADDDLPF